MGTEITVLLPVRNAAEYLPDAMGSLSAQTFGDWRCLALDDGSVDDSPALLDAHARADPRFLVLRRWRAGGVAAALRSLLARTETPWVARMDADDVCHPQRLEAQRAAARDQPEVDLWGSLVEILGPAVGNWPDFVAWMNAVRSPQEILREAFTECPLPHPTWFGRTAALREDGGYCEGPFAEDYDLFLRLLRRGRRFGKVPLPLLAWRDHPGRETRTSFRTRRDALLRLKARHFAEGYPRGELAHLPHRPVAVWGAGKTGSILLRELVARGVVPEVVVDPLNHGRSLAGLTVRPPDLSPPGRHLVLVAVGPRHLREELAARFQSEGRTFGVDYLWMY